MTLDGAPDLLIEERAPAKVNLALHVTGQRADGYHLLDSLVTFAAAGDRLAARIAPDLSLSIDGPFADDLGNGPDNLVLRAAALFGTDTPGAALRLLKSLPIASGIGGGSADAAAALRLLARLWGRPLPSGAAVVALGADVPVCLAGVSCRMQGIGEHITPAALPTHALLLVNPGIPVPTGAVFAGLPSRDNPPMPETLPPLPDAGTLAAFLRSQRNDLEPTAVEIAPVIADVLAAIGTQDGCLLARMSGSGATCFGLFAVHAAADAAAEAIRRYEPGWWVAAG